MVRASLGQGNRLRRSEAAIIALVVAAIVPDDDDAKSLDQHMKGREDAQRRRGNILVELATSPGVDRQRHHLVVISIADRRRGGRVEVKKQIGGVDFPHFPGAVSKTRQYPRNPFSVHSSTKTYSGVMAGRLGSSSCSGRWAVHGAIVEHEGLAVGREDVGSNTCLKGAAAAAALVALEERGGRRTGGRGARGEREN
ncbi:uncharacterized protein PG986_002332 [Apiospora aurea]|uniref:Uncharacterized protein n=1 Tax=Apiospora aurea TaxID=335848 RepID=A0ABR1R181_9PEZI